MAAEEHKVITKLFGVENLEDIEVYKANGGYQAIEKALKMSPDEVIQSVQDSGLAGRGGAWFNTGMKWSFMPKEGSVPSYLCVNGDESEPGTFKDRQLLEKNPHQLLEGALIAAYAIRGQRGLHIYPRRNGRRAGEDGARDRAGARCRLSGGEYSRVGLHPPGLHTPPGAGAYICGEEDGG